MQVCSGERGREAGKDTRAIVTDGGGVVGVHNRGRWSGRTRRDRSGCRRVHGRQFAPARPATAISVGSRARRGDAYRPCSATKRLATPALVVERQASAWYQHHGRLRNQVGASSTDLSSIVATGLVAPVPPDPIPRVWPLPHRHC
jgi:hypothetical protein